MTVLEMIIKTMIIDLFEWNNHSQYTILIQMNRISKNYFAKRLAMLLISVFIITLQYKIISTPKIFYNSFAKIKHRKYRGIYFPKSPPPGGWAFLFAFLERTRFSGQFYLILPILRCFYTFYDAFFENIVKKQWANLFGRIWGWAILFFWWKIYTPANSLLLEEQ